MMLCYEQFKHYVGCDCSSVYAALYTYAEIFEFALSLLKCEIHVTVSRVTAVVVHHRSY